MKNKKAVLVVLGICIPLLIVVVLSQTLLFTWSPLRIGYHRFHYDLYDLYTDEAVPAPVYGSLGEMIIQNERDHGLKYTLRPEIVICDVDRFRFYIPWLNSHTASGVWPRTVYLSKEIIREYNDPVMAAKHELSHILLLQHFGQQACKTVWEHDEWLPEGLAIYVTDGFPGYLSRREILATMKSTGIDYGKDSSDILSGKNRRDVAIAARYPIYGAYVGYLIEQYGRDTFFSFVYDTFDNPSEIMTLFSRHFRVSFAGSLTGFSEYLTK